MHLTVDSFPALHFTALQRAFHSFGHLDNIIYNKIFMLDSPRSNNSSSAAAALNRGSSREDDDDDADGDSDH